MWKWSLCATRHPPLKSFRPMAARDPLPSNPCVLYWACVLRKAESPLISQGHHKLHSLSPLLQRNLQGKPMRMCWLLLLRDWERLTGAHFHSLWGRGQESCLWICQQVQATVLTQWWVALLVLKRIYSEKVKPAWLDWINNLCANMWQQIWFINAWQGKYGLKSQK